VEIQVRPGDPLGEESELTILGCVEEDPLPGPLGDLLEAADFTASANTTRLLYPRGAVAPRRLLLVGLGRRESVDAEQIRQAAATAIREARGLQVSQVAIGAAGQIPVPAAEAGEALAEGLLLGAYRYLEHRTTSTEAERFEIDEVVVFGDGDGLAEGVAAGAVIAEATRYARDLVNRPPEYKTPPLLAQEAMALGQRSEGIEVTVFDEDRLAAEGFGGVLAVGRGSDSPPRFIVFEYGAHLEGAPTICVVGKGLTFDSGGLNIKPEEGMVNMKNDMGGGAAVFGILRAVAGLGLPLHVVGLVPSAENMPSGRSYRPGDVITTLSGRTVEILNTDAEGRVILSDALHYAQRYEPAAVIELSTLTGAVIIALGHVAAGLMATDDELAAGLQRAGDGTGDRVWPLPLWEDYRELVKSEIGDLKNLAGRPAGSITAGAFLAAFAGDVPFAHLDIAGTAWLDAPKKPYHSKGGTGAGVRVVTEFLRRYGA
jgi:leucyl aminopeptidase